LLDGVLDTKKGGCFSLSLLYLGLAERLGVPMYMVDLPALSHKHLGHVFIRYVGEVEELNIDAATSGLINPLTYYKREFDKVLQVSPDSLCANLSGKEVIISLGCNLCEVMYAGKKGHRSTRLLLEKMIALYPDGVSSLRWVGSILLKTGRWGKAAEMLKKACRLAPGDFLANSKLFVCLVVLGQRDSAIEVAKVFLQDYANHPAAHVMQLFLYGIIADPRLDTKYRLESLEEVEKALTFAQQYRKNYPDVLLDTEEKCLETLPLLLEQRKQELLQEQEK
jgi:tetratricopeptide (TPR) repeat protein